MKEQRVLGKPRGGSKEFSQMVGGREGQQWVRTTDMPTTDMPTRPDPWTVLAGCRTQVQTQVGPFPHSFSD